MEPFSRVTLSQPHRPAKSGNCLFNNTNTILATEAPLQKAGNWLFNIENPIIATEAPLQNAGNCLFNIANTDY